MASAATAEAADPALKEAVGGEVRSTVLLEDVEVEPGDCKANNEPSEVLTVDKAWIVPGLGATFFVRRAGGARRVCDSVITPSGVDVCSAAPERFPEDPSRLEGSGGQLNFCAEGDDRVAFLSVQLPEGAAWAAIMTEEGWDVYEVGESQVIRIARRTPPPTGDRILLTVKVLDKELHVIEEREVAGAVAG